MKAVTDTRYYDEIAKRIQACAGNRGKDLYKPSELAEGIGDVSSYQYEDGYYWGYQTRHTEFWDNITNNNTRTSFRYAFSGEVWNDTTFNPPYQLKPIVANNMFSHYNGITKITKAQVDFSQATDMTNTFGYYSRLVEIEEINVTSATNITDLCRYAHTLETIDRLILKESGSVFDTRTFYGCSALTNINEIEGLIDGTTVSFSSCPLTKASVLNIFNALKDYSGTDTKPVIQLHSTVKNADWFDDSIATGKGWDVA